MSNDPPQIAGSHDALSGRVAIVTGASRGIGAATARAVGAAGARVVLAARSAPALEKLAEELTNAGADALAVPTDVTDPDSVRRLVEQTLAAYGRLDLAVNNAAGGGHPPTALAQVAIEDYDSALAVTLRGVFLAMKYEIPAILHSGTATGRRTRRLRLREVRRNGAHADRRAGLRGARHSSQRTGSGTHPDRAAPASRQAGAGTNGRVATGQATRPARRGRRRGRLVVLRRGVVRDRHDADD